MKRVLDFTKKPTFSEDKEENDSSEEETPFSEEEDIHEDTYEDDWVEKENNSDKDKSKKKNVGYSAFMDFNNKIMFPESGLLLNDVIEMVMAFSIAFGLTSEGRKYLIEMLKVCAGPEFKYLRLTDYLLNKHFDPPASKIKYFFYCQKCQKKIVHSSSKAGITNIKKICSNCDEEITVSLDNKHVFLSIDFKYQMKILLNDKQVRECITKKIEPETAMECDTDKSITDIHDSQLYKKSKQIAS